MDSYWDSDSDSNTLSALPLYAATRNLSRRRRRRRRPTLAIESADPPTALTESAIAPASADPPAATTGSVTAPEEINPTGSATVPMDTQLVNQPTTTGTESSQDGLKSIFKLAQAPLAVAALSLALLLGFAPQSESIKPYLIVPYNVFFVMVWQSIFTSVGLTIYTFFKSTPSRDFAWFYKRLMIIAIGSFLIAVMLWLFLKLPLINMLYDGLCFVVIVIGIILYFWSSWRKANNSSQTGAGSEILLQEV